MGIQLNFGVAISWEIFFLKNRSKFFESNLKQKFQKFQAAINHAPTTLIRCRNQSDRVDLVNAYLSYTLNHKAESFPEQPRRLHTPFSC